MERLDATKHWDDDDRLYSSGRDSDESPILSYRYDKYRRYAPYVSEGKIEEKERRSTITVLAKFFLFCSAMILFCVLMYIPVYNRASDQVSKGSVLGWTVHTNRDPKIYVQPNNVTTVHEPKNICPKHTRHEKNKLFLLIVVCSATVNFEQRSAIRETWGNYEKYTQMSKLFNNAREKYKGYNYTYDLYSVDVGNYSKREKRDISSFGQLLPELAKALQDNLDNIKTDNVPDEKRFDDDEMLPGFDMNKELGEEQENKIYDYDYESNVMKIPPKGYEDSQDLGKILTMLKHNFPKINPNVEPDYKIMFLLGLPNENNTEVQAKIEEEVVKYGDILQEGFIDSYNNLTLKSIMMLKWVTNNCNESVRYILKADDDIYINVPNLMLNLRNRSKSYDGKVAAGYKDKEYLLIGDLICGAKPVLDPHSKWFSPAYMYHGRVYPRYLSGTGYVLTIHTARALYAAALNTHYFHLEDIYITGLCALRAKPRIPPTDDPSFTFQSIGNRYPCYAHSHVTSHRVTTQLMRTMHEQLSSEEVVDRCERIRLTQIHSEKQSKSRLHDLFTSFISGLTIVYGDCTDN